MVTSIEWAQGPNGERGRTWNPTTGCDRVSPGCDNCYALGMAGRLKAMGQAKYQTDGDPRTSGPGFGLATHPDVLDVPLRRRVPTTYFVNSMSDLFHPNVPDAFIAQVFATMAMCPRHTFQVLTKRPQRMAALLSDADRWLGLLDAAMRPLTGDIFASTVPSRLYPPAWEWLGTSIESDRYTFRAHHLRATPAAVRFLSLEPLLGPLPSLDLTGIDWVIVGGESGRDARPMHPGWVRDIRDRCVEAGIPFFFKQWGSVRPWRSGDDPWAGVLWDGCEGDALVSMVRVSKKVAGRELDGRTWDEMPERVSA